MNLIEILFFLLRFSRCLTYCPVTEAVFDKFPEFSKECGIQNSKLNDSTMTEVLVVQKFHFLLSLKQIFLKIGGGGAIYPSASQSTCCAYKRKN